MSTIRRSRHLGAALAIVACVGASAPAQETPASVVGHVLQLHIDGEPITPVTARFIERAIRQAESEHASCAVLVLDTPGGLLDSTRDAVRTILRARVPVVVHVPAGGRAASAGMFLVLAGHVASMAPGSNIGAAHPVQIGGLPIGPPAPSEPGQEEGDPARSSPLADKAVQDTSAWARALAELRGRDAGWAARAVEESLSASAEEALRGGVIDVLAIDVADLLRQIDGRTVTVAGGASRTLRTAGAPVHSAELWWGERLLLAVSDPNVAFLLLIFGFYGILFELNSPGWGVAGTLGVICLLLAFFGLAVLPVNYVGLGLIGLALALFTAEVFVTSFGVLALGGVACLVLGGLMLVDSPAGFLRVSLSVVIPIAVATGAITVFLVSQIVKAHRGRVRTGAEGLIGEPAIADAAFAESGEEFAGTVRAHGEYWKAQSHAPVTAHQELRVVDRRGLTLVVDDAEPPRVEASIQRDSDRP